MIQIQQQACRGCGTTYHVRKVPVSMKTGGQLTCPKCGGVVVQWISADYFYQFEGPLPRSAAEIDTVRPK